MTAIYKFTIRIVKVKPKVTFTDKVTSLNSSQNSVLKTATHRQTNDSKTAVVFCWLAHLPVARSNLTLGSSPMICGGFYAEASPRRRLKTTEGIDHFSSALALRREIFSLFISFSTLFLHQYYVKFFIFSFKISVIFVKLLRHIFSILQYFFFCYARLKSLGFASWRHGFSLL